MNKILFVCYGSAADRCELAVLVEQGRGNVWHLKWRGTMVLLQARKQKRSYIQSKSFVVLTEIRY